MMPFIRSTKHRHVENLPANGMLSHDKEALTLTQRQCTARLGVTMQLEQEAYLHQHPEVKAMLVKFCSHMIRTRKRKDILQETAKFFTRPADVMDSEIREMLKMPANVKGAYIKGDKPTFHYKDLDLEYDLRNIILKNSLSEPWEIPTEIPPTPDTASSSFASLVTSETTVPTPEPIPTPEPMLSEVFYAVISNVVDKAIYQRVDDQALKYDTAYVELSKAVEEAMEIPVTGIREDIARLIYNAYKFFELDIMEKERIAAEIAWEKRMRKKLKRTLRQLQNFKGYETPPTPKSQLSSHPSYKIPPPRPCECHPQIFYNRYSKDRFGIYLPKEDTFPTGNVTVTPAISTESLGELAMETSDVKSAGSKKSAVSNKSAASKKTTTFQ
ncbi:hypothetical protein ACJJTC_012906, partial [Scirpophaga incertulas]